MTAGKPSSSNNITSISYIRGMEQTKRARTPFLFCLFFLMTTTGNAQGFLKVSGKNIVNENGENVLLRGMGLGGWMLQEGYMLRVNGEGQQHKIRARIKELVGEEKTQAFYNTWLANHTRKIDIDSMKAWGFNSVRLPMHYNLYTLPVEQEPVAGEHTWLEKGFAMTDSLLSWCKANGMYLILDLHAAPGGQGKDLNISDGDTTKPSLWQSEANRQKTIALWKKLAERYADEPWIGGYDLLNEPNWGFEDLANDRNGLKEQKNEPLKKLLVDITNTIREVDTKHIIIIEGNGWGNNYNGMLPPWDSNMVLSFHKYWSYNNSETIQYILDAREKYKVPVWLGETGENSNVWFAEAIRLLEDHNIGWAWWPLKKLGINNPMQVHTPPGYEKILNYWGGKGEKPSADEAYQGVMELAGALKLENTIIKKDVLDAMFRQPYSYTALPYKANRIVDGTVLQAVDYDLGRNGIAYFDKDTANYYVSGGSRGGNQGRQYRNDGVDISRDSSVQENYYVSFTEAGEWLQYTTQVPATASYTIHLKVLPGKAKGKIKISVNNKPVTNAIIPAAAAQKPKWQLIELKNISLQKGSNTIRLYIEAGGFGLKEMKFTSGSK